MKNSKLLCTAAAMAMIVPFAGVSAQERAFSVPDITGTLQTMIDRKVSASLTARNSGPAIRTGRVPAGSVPESRVAGNQDPLPCPCPDREKIRPPKTPAL